MELRRRVRPPMLLLLLLAAPLLLHPPFAASTVLVDVVHGQSLEGNLVDYSPDRRVWVYLPARYR